MVFTVFDRDALYDIKQHTDVFRQGFNTTGFGTSDNDANELNPAHSNMITRDRNVERWTKAKRPHYSDEIPPYLDILF